MLVTVFASCLGSRSERLSVASAHGPTAPQWRVRTRPSSGVSSARSTDPSVSFCCIETPRPATPDAATNHLGKWRLRNLDDKKRDAAQQQEPDEQDERISAVHALLHQAAEDLLVG